MGDLNVKPKDRTFLEKKQVKKSLWPELGKDFLDMSSKAKYVKE